MPPINVNALHVFECGICRHEVRDDARMAINARVRENGAIESRPVCFTCQVTDTSTCAHCGIRYHDDLMQFVGGMGHVCQTCAEEVLTTCEGCGAMRHPDSMEYDPIGEQNLCNSCMDNLKSELIRGYYFKPEPNFLGGDSLTYFGWEIEVDKGGNHRNNVDPIHAAFNADDDYVYFKHDGSLDNGFEMVSHPATLEYHLKSPRIQEAFMVAMGNGYDSHDTDTCGLHFHISRTAFGADENHRMHNYSRFLYLVEKFYAQVLELSRRDADRMDRWAARYGLMENDCPATIYKNKELARGNRYNIINFNNAHTVEIRAFRGTLIYETFVATLQFVAVLLEVATSRLDLIKMTWEDFKALGAHFEEFQNYCKERNV